MTFGVVGGGLGAVSHAALHFRDGPGVPLEKADSLGIYDRRRNEGRSWVETAGRTLLGGCAGFVGVGLMSFLAARTSLGRMRVLDALNARPQAAASVLRTAGGRAGVRACVYTAALICTCSATEFPNPTIAIILVVAWPLLLPVFGVGYVSGSLLGLSLGRRLAVASTPLFSAMQAARGKHIMDVCYNANPFLTKASCMMLALAAEWSSAQLQPLLVWDDGFFSGRPSALGGVLQEEWTRNPNQDANGGVYAWRFERHWSTEEAADDGQAAPDHPTPWNLRDPDGHDDGATGGQTRV